MVVLSLFILESSREDIILSSNRDMVIPSLFFMPFNFLSSVYIGQCMKYSVK